MAFKLLLLPDVVLFRVLVKMSKRSLINFAMSSKANEILVKSCMVHLKPKNFHFDYYGSGSHFTIWFENNSYLILNVLMESAKEDYYVERRTLNNHQFWDAHVEEEYVYISCWENIITGTKVFLDYLTDLFNIQINHFSAAKMSGINNREFETILSWAPPILKAFRVTAYKPIDWNEEEEYKDVENDGEKLLNIVEKYNNVEFLDLDFDTVDRGLNVDFSNSCHKKISIGYARWLTVQNVLQMKFVDLRVRGSEWTNENVNEMLKMWKNGWNPAMKSIVIVNDRIFDSVAVLDQLDAVVEDGVEGYQIKRESDGAVVQFSGDLKTITISVVPISAPSGPPSKRIRIV